MDISGIQKTILEKLKQGMENGKQLSLRNIGDNLSLAPNTILYHLKKLEAKGLLVRDAGGKVIRINTPSEGQAIAFLPLLGNARCGEPLDQIVDSNTIRMIPVPLFLLGRNNKKKLYLIKAVGDSMSPKIEAEDFVVFEPNPAPQNGDVVVARTNEGFTIKKYKQNKNQLILEPLNPNYQPLIFDKSDIENKEFNIDGVSVGVFKSQINLKEEVR